MTFPLPPPRTSRPLQRDARGGWFVQAAAGVRYYQGCTVCAAAEAAGDTIFAPHYSVCSRQDNGFKTHCGCGVCFRD